MTTCEEKVHRGIALLDNVLEGWESRINLDTLYLSSSQDCILGQLYGTYAVGRLELFGISNDSCSCPRCDPEGLKNGDAVEHGVFAADLDYAELQDLWKEEILQRRLVG